MNLDLSVLKKEYEALKSKGLNLDMSRGKPCGEQLDLAASMLSMDLGDFKSEEGFDCRNYGLPFGLNEAKRLFAPILGVEPENIIVGGNSSLRLVYDVLTQAYIFGVTNELEKSRPWAKYDKPVKFLCPAPGYDRHFTMLEAFGIETLPIPTDENGPDLDMTERLAAEDEYVKGIICVPMYSNPDGFTYSDEAVKRLARMKTKAGDFRIFWDNAYGVHHLYDEPDKLLNIARECEKAGNPDRVYIFSSTSKISFAGGGISALGSSDENIKSIKNHISVQTIGFDKINQLRHARFFKNYDGITEHMKKHSAIIKPKFDVVFDILERELSPHNLGEWNEPRGGYFISFNGLKGTAKRVVELCGGAGLIMTSAGATFPNGHDPEDKNIRIAPTYPPLSELISAMEVFCASVKLASAETLNCP